MDWNDLGVSDQARRTLSDKGVGVEHLHRFFAHPTVLAENPDLLDYYRSLAGMSENRLGDMKSVRGAVRSLRRSNSMTLGENSELNRLCQYFNSLISTWASGLTDKDPKRKALVSALLTEGAAIEGSSRNAGGRKAVVNVASVLIEDFSEHDCLDSFVIKEGSDDEFERIPASKLGDEYVLSDVSGAYDVREIETGKGTVNVDATEPDLVVSTTTDIVGYGEIKDRKDKSNQWEGWLPNVRSKLEGFKQNNPSAKRILLQPVFTRRMVEGERGHDTEDVGVRYLVEQDLLDVPFNINKILADESHRDFFGAYVRDALGYQVDDLTPPQA
ncbi:XcyI family restriction endonuclease [Halorussus pelagicus]|uniref:XcyI family restriction endonuclease n=1 Tax=Halorussus pelagicus TaxID=2505977 RepID=UPI00140BC4DC|nr:XcyI family restriction endonuclease [Halorussus pelagicus]